MTNSRDTQELPPDVGREMLRIFSEYRSRTCIMDDWNWYDEREIHKATKAADGTGEDGASPESSATLEEDEGKAEEAAVEA